MTSTASTASTTTDTNAPLEPTPPDVHVHAHQPIPWQLATVARSRRSGRLTIRYAAPDRPELHAVDVSLPLHSRDANDPARRPHVELPPLPPDDILRLYLERAHHAIAHGSTRWPCTVCATTTTRAPALTLLVRSVPGSDARRRRRARRAARRSEH